MKMSRLVMGSAVAVSLVGAGLLASPASAQECGVSVYGGDVMNETVIDISANAGTSISDSSAGSNNLATTNGGGGAGVVTNVASAGNGGVATSAANGGAISTGNINSGGNAGNAISVGDTYCDVAAYEPVYDDVVYEEPVYEAEAVVALPSTGVGAGEISGIFAVLASAGAAAASFGLRRR